MKVSLVYSHAESHWLSCQFITKNLLASYMQLFGNDQSSYQVINFHKDLSFYTIEKLAHSIFHFKPDSVIFIDHAPHPQVLIKLIYSVYRNTSKILLPSLVFHVYGDFTLLSWQWLDSMVTLKKFKIKWICASDAQVKLVRKFIERNKKSIFLLPFPVDDTNYFYSKSLREKSRKELGIKEKEIVFVYSGRISYQKRVATLLDLFDRFLKETLSQSRLILVGPFDNLGNSYTGEYFQDGEFAQKFLNYFQMLSSSTQKKIRYIGCIDQQNLNKVYNAADIFVSLSTHNDEDYGMAPAEALCAGLPAILTNWGGYYSFKEDDNDVHLIPTQIDPSKVRITVSLEGFLEKATIAVSNISQSQKKRHKLAKLNASRVNVKSVSEFLRIILEKDFRPFAGFTDNMNKIHESFKSEAPFVASYTKYSEFYCELYENYISKKL